MSESKLLDEDVAESTVRELEEEFFEELEELFEHYNMSYERVDTELESVLFDTFCKMILELGKSAEVEYTVEEQVDKCLEEFGSSAGRQNIVFTCGRAEAECGSKVLQELYGAIIKKDREPYYD